MLIWSSVGEGGKSERFSCLPVSTFKLEGVFLPHTTRRSFAPWRTEARICLGASDVSVEDMLSLRMVESS